MHTSLRRLVGGRYLLEAPLGQGGMGEVWRAVHVELETRVAVKLLSTALASDATALARFRHEARAAARLRSHHVVQVFDYGAEDGLPYIVMELLEGETLQERLDRTNRVGLSLAAVIVEDASTALALAHAHGIVHRDIKPSNLFMTGEGQAEHVKVLDFGIAKVGHSNEPGITLSGSVVGSPGFMSPEQANGRHVDLRSDLWSLGAIAFRMLTGEAPFRGTTLEELALNLKDGPPRATRLCPDLPPELDEFFRRALSVDPGDRHASAREFASAFMAAAHVHAPDEVARSARPPGRDGVTCSLSIDPHDRVRSRRGPRPALVVSMLALGGVLVAMVVSFAQSRVDVARAAAHSTLDTDEPRRFEPLPLTWMTPASFSTFTQRRGAPSPALGAARGERRKSPPAPDAPAAPNGATTRATTDPLFGLPLHAGSPSPPPSAAVAFDAD